MTKDEAIQKFRSMWRVMGKHRITKTEYFNEFAPKNQKILGRCYLCLFVASHPGTGCCPIDWSPASGCASLEGENEVASIFRLWEIALTMNDRIEMGRLALLISELPEKVGYRE